MSPNDMALHQIKGGDGRWSHSRPYPILGLTKLQLDVGDRLVPQHVDEDGEHFQFDLGAAGDPLVSRDGGDEVRLHHVDPRM